ncbi:translocation/assembly module TamB domain-containing protein [Baaleninema simplex]|uniref:translocation/assembly module TamB domain-containing protein n=1 Tax=Baaleninema simplex TaxID=2862350 RepID=UPI0003472FF5|nr:translocation/assembly module TamB [Baaleninema simplex]
MTESPEPTPQNEPQPPRKRFPKLRLTLAVLCLTGVAGGVWWGWRFVHLQLAPLLSRELEKLFDRPVVVGELDSFSLTRVRFGESEIPETPEHPSRAEIDAVSVRFNPLQILWNRTLSLDIVVEDPDITLNQTEAGEWVTTQIRTGGEPGFVKIDLETIAIEDGTLTLQPQPKAEISQGKTIGKETKRFVETPALSPAAIVLRRLEAEVEFEDEGTIVFDATGYHNVKERLSVQGEYNPELELVRLNLSAQYLAGNVVAPWIPDAIDLDGGEIFGNLTVEIATNAPGELPNLQGNLRFSDLDLQIGGVPQTIRDSSGRLRFQNTLIAIEEAEANYGNVPMQVPQGALSLEEGYEIPIAVPPIEWQVVQNTLGVDFPVEVTGELEAALKLVGPLETPVLIGEAQTTDVAIVDRIPFSDLTARFALSTATSEFVIEQLNAVPEGGGQVQAAVKVQLPQTSEDAPQVLSEFLIRDASADAIARRYELPTTSDIGRFNARGQFESNEDGAIVRLPIVEIAGGQAQGGILLADDRWQVELATEGVSLDSAFPTEFVNTFEVGNYSGEVVLGGDYEATTLEDIEVLAQGNLGFFGQPTQVQAVLARGGQWETILAAENFVVPPSRLAPTLQNLGIAPLSGNLRLTGDLSYFETGDLAQITAETSLTTAIAGSQTRLDGQLAGGRWQAAIASEGLPVTPFVTLPPELAQLEIGRFAGQAQVAGTLDALENPSLDNIEVAGNGRLSVEDGAIELGFQVARGRLEGSAVGQEVEITPLLPVSELGRVALAGQVNFTAPVADLSPQTVTAEGQVALLAENGVLEAGFQVANGRWAIESEQFAIPLDPFIDAPVTLTPLQNIGKVARLSGSVSDLRPEAVSGQFQVGFGFGDLSRGKVDPSEVGNVAIDATLDKGQWRAQVVARNADLGVLLPAYDTDIATANVQGQLGGAVLLSGGWNGFVPANVEIGGGEVQLANLRLNDTAFDPLFVGAIESDETGVKVDLQGVPVIVDDEPDEISVWLDRDLTLREFSIDLDDAEASGTLENEVLRFDLEGLPLSWFDVRPPLDRGPLSGTLSLNLTADLPRQRVAGSARLLDPTLGLTQADVLQGQFFFDDGVLALTDVALRKEDSFYRFSGRVGTDANAEVRGVLDIQQGQIQDILTALRWFDLRDIARGLDPATYAGTDAIDVAAVGLPQAPIVWQLRRLAEIDALLAQQRQAREDASPLPELETLAGTFSGEVQLAGSVKSGIDFGFALGGEDWQWEDYAIHEIAISGEFADGLWQLEPSVVRANLSPDIETRLQFSGLIGGREQSAQFQLTGLPVSVVSEFVTFPPAVQLDGSFDASATLAGSFENPRARGELRWTNGRINQQPVVSAQGGFGYDDARLNLGGAIVLVEPEPISIQANIPVEFPGATVRPDDESFRVSVDVENEGLAILDALTGGSLAWRGGEGSMRLTVEGERVGGGFNYLPTSTRGIAEFRNAAFDSPQLPEPLTQVNGAIEFRDDTIVVPELVGQFRQGSVRAMGELPLLSPQAVEMPLQVAFDRVGLNLKGLYRGTIDGLVGVGGSALFPELGGELLLTNGQILIPDPSTTTVSSAPDPDAVPEISYDNLTLELGRNVQIISPPVLNFVARGQLELNGLFDNPQPQGTIFLQDGQVNVFTTTFNLARGRHTATFSPQYGSDPVLDVRLRTAVQETTRPRIVSPVGFNELGTTAEISEPAIERGAVETVRIEARVRGRASRLFENLELTSSPSRTQTEIYSLIGGGALGTFGQQDTSLVVASSALLTQVQSIIGQALGYRDFRLFPAVDPRTSALGLGAEVGVSITDDLAVSVLTILDRDDSTRFSIRYRIDDNWLIRGSTNFEEDNRAVVEYQLRF